MSAKSGSIFLDNLRTMYNVCYVSIMALGIVGNIMVLLVIFKTKGMRSSTNIFLANLAIADLMVLLLCIPQALVQENPTLARLLSKEICKVSCFVGEMVISASVLTILGIGYERYYVICKPLKAASVCTKGRARRICVLAWLLAAVCTCPFLSMIDYTEDKYSNETNEPSCTVSTITSWEKSYHATNATVFFFLPMAVLLILYVMILRQLTSETVDVAPGSSTAAKRYRRKLVAMLGVVILDFFICLLPYKAYFVVPSEVILELMTTNNEAFTIYLFFLRVMVYLHSAMNPILYNLMSEKFRAGFRSVCCSKVGTEEMM